MASGRSAIAGRSAKHATVPIHFGVSEPRSPCAGAEPCQLAHVDLVTVEKGDKLVEVRVRWRSREMDEQLETFAFKSLDAGDAGEPLEERGFVVLMIVGDARSNEGLDSTWHAA